MMTLQSRRMSKRGAEPVSFDITLNYDITWADNAQLTVEFIKFLCVQKGQIPVPCSQLQKLSDLARIELEKDFKDYKTSKEKAVAFKTKRKQMQFVKKADNFQKNLKDLCEGVTNCFEAQNEQVAIVLGTSIFNQREVFILDWSHWPAKQLCKTTSDKNDLKKNLANFFRFLVTTENLFSILQAVRPSHLHVLCLTTSLAPTGCIPCIPRLNFKPSTRVPQITLRILPKSQIPLNLLTNNYHDNEYDEYAVDTHSHRTVSRRLVFSSPAPAKRIIHENHFSLLDISGIGRLDDDNDKSCNGEAISDNLPNRCWFQIQSSLTGFVETFILNS